MKRMTALVLALVTLLMPLAARADSFGTRLDMNKLRVSLRGSKNKSVVKLHHMDLALALGSAEGVPTIQATLDYDEQVDIVVQLVDTRLLFSMGGVNGTFYVDLATLLGDEEKAQLLSTGMGAGITMFGLNPELVMELSMPKNKKGNHVATFEVPRELWLALGDRVLDMLKGSDSGVDVKAARKDLHRNKKKVRVKVIYNPEKHWIRLRFLRGKKGYQLYGKVNLTSEAMEFINISADEEQYDLMNLDEEMQESLRNDMDFLSLKAERFTSSVNLNKLTQSKPKSTDSTATEAATDDRQETTDSTAAEAATNDEQDG